MHLAVLAWAQMWLQSDGGQGQSHLEGVLTYRSVGVRLSSGALAGTVGRKHLPAPSPGGPGFLTVEWPACKSQHP